MKPFTSLLLALLVIVVAACNTPTASPLPEPTQTSSISTPTTPASTPTKPAPTVTAIVPPTVEPTLPPAVLNPAGPYGIMMAEDGLWALNPDGSALTYLVGDSIMAFALSPDGKTLAYVASVPETTYGMELKLLTLPDGTLHSIARLDIPLPANPSDAQYAASQDTWGAVFNDDSLAWSPDGSLLAFVSGQDGISSDVYTYSPAADKITRLTDGPAMAYGLHWSPDGKYILHAGAETFGTGAGYVMSGVWVVTTDAQVLTMYTPDAQSGGEELIGWVDNDTFLVNSWYRDCGSKNLRTMDVYTRTTHAVFPGYFESLVYNPFLNAVLLNVNGYMSNCPGNPVEGTYIARPNVAPQKIADVSYAPHAEYTADGWYAHNLTNGSGLVFFNADGTMTVIDDRPPMRENYAILSPDHLYWVAHPLGEGLWVASAAVAPFRIITGTTNILNWSPDSQNLFFYVDEGGGLIRLYIAQAPGFTPVLLSEEIKPAYNQGRPLIFTP